MPYIHEPEEYIFKSDAAVYVRCIIKHTAMDAIPTLKGILRWSVQWN